jgi:ribosomal-protein-alanine N-acetyltransferase
VILPYDVRLRPATADDVPAMASLETQSFGPAAWSPLMLVDELAAPGRVYLAAIKDGDLIGFGGAYLGPDTADVMTIEVGGTFRGRGIGRGILQALIEAAREAGCRDMMLEVRVDNAVAIGLYERLGFQRIGLRRGYYQPENADALTMRLELRPSVGPVGGAGGIGAAGTVAGGAGAAGTGAAGAAAGGAEAGGTEAAGAAE